MQIHAANSRAQLRVSRTRGKGIAQALRSHPLANRPWQHESRQIVIAWGKTAGGIIDRLFAYARFVWFFRVWPAGIIAILRHTAAEQLSLYLLEKKRSHYLQQFNAFCRTKFAE